MLKDFLCVFYLIVFLPSFVWSAVDLVKVDKSERKMHLLENSKVVKTYAIALGSNPKGHKYQ